jgi:thiamine kinase-like enzyme
MNYSRRVIVDFDDTLAHTLNRNWESAEPNQPLINKLNSLVDSGWVVDIYTARGSISCKTRQEADEKYRQQIESWLNRHNVKYNMLSFDKPLGVFYIDDKAHTPESFLDLEIRDLRGLSGASVYSDGKLVHKTDKNTPSVVEWFNTANSIGILTPRIHTVIGDTLSMEYIENVPRFFESNSRVAMGLIFDVIDRFSNISVEQDMFTFTDYLYRIEDHIKLIENDAHKQICEVAFEQVANEYLPYSFAHGDFGITNLLFTPLRQLYLIDPITTTFTSPVIDLAKLCASLLLNGYDKNYHDTLYACIWYTNRTLNSFLPFVLSELIRVYKYHPDKDFVFSLIEDLLNTLEFYEYYEEYF